MSFSRLEILASPRINFFIKNTHLIRSCFAGLLLPLSFAPFHFPGLAILGIAILFSELQNKPLKTAALIGFIFSLAFMGVGISWIFISINLYGHLNIFLSGLITITFVIYLSIFYAIQAVTFSLLQNYSSKLMSALTFSACWCICEYLRANFATGFPWLIIGFGQIDSPLKYLLPYIGIYGVSFCTCLASCLLCHAVKKKTSSKSYENIPYLISFLAIILLPIGLKHTKHQINELNKIPVGVVQANLSMHEKWDEAIFEKMLKRYENGINNLKTNAKLIVLPESAIPVPEIYAYDFMNKIQQINEKHEIQTLIGLPKQVGQKNELYYNALTSFGSEKRAYLKQHLVPFGEYIPKPFYKITSYLEIPDAAMIKGPTNQPLLKHNNLPFATLICFEVAYPEILRAQMPKAQWIVSVSDAGWFGHSLAIYQLLQMSQSLSIMTNRYQVVANNNGLSAIIDSEGKIINSLPAFRSMDLYGKIHSLNTKTIWIKYGDSPYIYLCIVIIIIALFKKKRYPYRSILQ